MAAPTNSLGLGVYVEVRQQIRAVQAVLRINSSVVNDDTRPERSETQNPGRVQVEIHPETLHFVTSSDDCRSVFSLAPIRILPKTCNGLNWVEDEGLHMRLQLAGTREAGNQLEQDEAREKEELDFLRSTACVVVCGVCSGKVATNPCIFDRVLPLPSENWREMSETWCCHGNEGTRTFANRSLRPQERDCLVGNLYFLLHPSMLCKDAVLLTSQKGKQRSCGVAAEKSETLHLLCRRCRSSLGEAVADVNIREGEEWQAVHSLKLFKHSIRMQPQGEDPATKNVFNSYNTEFYLAKHLASLSQMNTTFKFILEEESSRQPYLLLWLLSSDTLLLTSDASPVGYSDARFHGYQHQRACDVSNAAQCSCGECGCIGDSEIKRQAVDAHRIVKVLYQTSWDEEGKRLHAQWSKDLSIMCIPLPKATCLELMLLLATSHQHTPASMRNMNGFKVGYLRY
ncbi:E3 ubiquitin-protein ligase E3D-like isoform X2 [Patiria miniata]|uniref:E3 ubiquitin-protein ligase E3D n=1 Tax=Patiria miniata TaxID=46514 RepID=A0A914A5I0_PATMI|nr:E3 ubiquitin-protein ligase E3D-like isoform X2 [Patiria miniata]